MRVPRLLGLGAQDPISLEPFGFKSVQKQQFNYCQRGHSIFTPVHIFKRCAERF